MALRKLFFMAATGAALIGGCNFGVQKATEETIEVTVTDKERLNKKDSDGKYLVYTKDANGKVETFENTDAWFYGKFNSSDVQGGLEEGKSYKVTVNGFRIPILSSYRNIVKAEPATKPPAP